ncbi:MAG: anthranilate phosphoribosyltransferase [Phycisphaerales bacterium]|nr:anthranilate phosphoribosyltransferase [Phycisphaerales bacterium]
MQDLLAHLLTLKAMTGAQAERAFSDVLTGQANEVQVGAMLALIAAREPTLEEIVAGARVMRAHATNTPIAEDLRDSVIDTCGTGGAPKTFNISTAVAFVVAGAQGVRPVRVVKHGGRSRTGRGSAEVLAHLGVNIDAPPEVEGACLREIGVCFCFAVNHHPAMRYAAVPRKSLGFPTIFNLLGPLTNPAGATRQLMGVYDGTKVRMIAGALGALGSVDAMVVHGEDGMDEITTTGATRFARVRGGVVSEGVIEPGEYGIARATLDDLRVTTLDGAADVIRRVLGGERCAARGIVELNAAAALMVGGAAPDMGVGVALARESIDSGRAAAALDGLIEISSRK